VNTFWSLIAIVGVFLLAGGVKGVIGMGLPTVAIGLLGSLMTPAEAAAILVLPTLVTNIWQAAVGRGFFSLLRRLWPMFAGIFVGGAVGAMMLGSVASPWATTALGVALVIYSALGLSNVHFTVAPPTEPWLAPIIGVVNGVVSVATGVFSLPAVPYLHALHLNRDDLVQALGMLFTISTVALAVVLMHGGILHLSAAGMSAVALAASLVGMVLGQRVRGRVKPETFRLCFFVGLLLLGLHLAVRGLL
jgi:uncharacterized membrane protein YfcA